VGGDQDEIRDRDAEPRRRMPIGRGRGLVRPHLVDADEGVDVLIEAGRLEELPRIRLAAVGQ
jgi:hypothetical protein